MWNFLRRPLGPVSWAAFFAGVLVVGIAAGADEPTTSPEAQPTLRDLLERVQKLEAELKSLRTARDQSTMAMVEAAQLGLHYTPKGQTRFAVVRVILTNDTSNAIEVPRTAWRVIVDGEERDVGPLPDTMKNLGFQFQGQGISFNAIAANSDVRLASGGVASVYIAVPDLPTGGNVPRLSFKLKLGEREFDLDVNRQQAALLGMEVERIGPRNCLGLVTIGGQLTAINAGAIVEALDQLAADKIGRAVVQFRSTGPQSDAQALSWLQFAAMGASTGRATNDQFPSFPAAMREVHVAELPSRSVAVPSGDPRAGQFVHATAAAAVAAALKSILLVLPRNELLQEIRQGHPLVRAAAVLHSGGRLDAADLPLILDLVDHADPTLQSAAIQALGHYGDDVAIEKLIAVARKNVEPLSPAAIEALAGSRFSAAQDAILKLFESEEAAGKKTIIQMVTKRPRPAWSPVLFELVDSRNPALQVDALRALAVVGHPKLQDSLERALSSKQDDFRKAAFELLAARTDERSEKAALEYSLAAIAKEPPDPSVQNVIVRLKPPEAIPHLLRHFDQLKDRRTQLIPVLAAVGNQTVAFELANRYPKLTVPEQSQVIGALRSLRSNRFHEIAGSALVSSNSQLVSAACAALQQDPGPQTEKLLIDSLEKQSQQSGFQQICNVLAQFGSNDVRAALRKYRDGDDAQRKTAAQMALQNIRARSPGMQYVHMAQAQSQNKQWSQAKDSYDLAAEADPELPEAFVGRGHVRLQLNQFAEAQADFETGLRLESQNALGVTGLGLALVMQGKLEDGLKQIDDARGRFKDDAMFAYNASCAYGRAYEQSLKKPESPERAAAVEKYKAQTLQDLEASIKLGFQDFAHIKDDPDLAAVRELPEFNKLVTTPPAPTRRPRGKTP